MKYIYRGIVIVNYDEETKQLDFPNDEYPNGNINHVRMLPEDTFLLQKFFGTAYLHQVGGAYACAPFICLDDTVVN